MPRPTFVILAAGEGTRMRSATPKVLHPICGRPLILWPVAAARAAAADARVVLVDNPNRRLAAIAEEHGLETAIQETPQGTGDAVRAAVDHFGDDDHVVVLSGDVPLLTATTIAQLLEHHESSGAAATMLTMVLDDPSGYGRVVRDKAAGDTVVKVVETKKPGDATPEELEIAEVNSGIYAFTGGPLKQALAELVNENAQGEYYLPDVLPALASRGHRVEAYVAGDPDETLGVNGRRELAEVRVHAQRRVHDHHARNGVTIVDPASTLIEVDVEIGQDAVVEPSSFLRGTTRIGSGATIGPLTTLIDCEIGDGARIVHSYAEGATLAEHAQAGPFAYLRPNARLEAKAKAGAFVEIKNSTIGAGSKVPHLSYIGDADIGSGSNIGAGTITANYDGRNKHRTTIGSGVRISVDTMLVAPVTVEDNAYTGAGSVITENVPPGALGIARARQTNVEGYAERRNAQEEPKR